jgi:hypothetical protein
MSSRRHSIPAKKGKIVAIPSQPLKERSQPLFLGLVGTMSKEEYWLMWESKRQGIAQAQPKESWRESIAPIQSF